MSRVLVIAEAGVNHNGDLETAKSLIDVAAESGADYVKFQTFKADNLVSKDAPKADYQTRNTGTDDSQYSMLKRLELDEKDHLALIEHCKLRKINFLSTAFDLESLDLLIRLGVQLFKIPSGEITNYPMLKKVGALRSKVILSTGMSTMEEIAEAIEVLIASGTAKRDVTVLHCNTEYPTPMADVNLLAMNTIRDTFDVAVGYSDHTLGTEVPVAAVALGAVVIEKHFTLDRGMAGPDHAASLEPSELKAMVSAIRNIESARGSAIKQPSPSELKNRAIARKSVHLVHDLNKGHRISETDLVIKRPGDGISPMKLPELLGKILKHDKPAGSKLLWEDLQ